METTSDNPAEAGLGLSARCPACGYDLRGLPATCTCPECGLPCDPHAMIVKLSPWQRHPRDVAIGIVLMVLVTWMGVRFGPLDTSWLILVGVVGLATLIAFIALCGRVGQRSRLLLTHLGIRFDDPKLDRGWIEWSSIDHADYSWLTGHLYLIGKDRKVVLRLRFEQVGSPSVARKCARAINAQRRHYLSG